MIDMQSICPVCNGFTRLQTICSTCQQPIDDAGRLADYFGDYSPYREIDDAKLTNGFLDVANHECIHVGWCPRCRNEQLFVVSEQSPADITMHMQTIERTLA